MESKADSTVRWEGSGQYRMWHCVLNNPTEDYVTQLQQILTGLHTRKEISYAIFGREEGEEKHTPHLQTYIRFTKPRRLLGVKEILKNDKWHCDRVWSTEARNVTYCGKDGKTWSIGKQTDPGTAGRMSEQERWGHMRQLAAQGAFDELNETYPREGTIHSRKFEEIFYKAAQARITALPEAQSRARVNVWLFGKPDLGKSRWALQGWGPNAGMSRYVKMHNKWFDDYRFEDVVIIDDLDQSGHTNNLAMYKHLGDAHPFRVEVKGASMMIRPKVVIITSNQSLQDVFSNQRPEHVEALKSRYQEIEIVRRADTFEEACSLQVFSDGEFKRQPGGTAGSASFGSAEPTCECVSSVPP